MKAVGFIGAGALAARRAAGVKLGRKKGRERAGSIRTRKRLWHYSEMVLPRLMSPGGVVFRSRRFTIG
jgi:hypothetical protein